MTTPTKPKPATDTLRRVVRGGSWYNTSATNVRGAYRYGVSPTHRDDSIGFRCAQSGCRQQILRGTSP